MDNNKNTIDLNDFINNMEDYIQQVNKSNDILYINDSNNNKTYVLLSERNYTDCLNNIND